MLLWNKASSKFPSFIKDDLKIKIYYSRPDLNGIYRKQAQELIRYENTFGYRCINQSDWEALLNYINSLKD